MEKWKKIPNMEHYEASNLGRLRSLTRLCTIDAVRGQYQRLIPGRILKPMYRWRNGFPCYINLKANGKTLYAHRLVAMAWLNDSYFEGAEVNHRDGNSHNNRVENLEWVTRQENELHSYRVLGKGKKKNRHLPRKPVIKCSHDPIFPYAING